MAPKRLVLLQGPQSGVFWRTRLSAGPEKWIYYDPRAFLALSPYAKDHVFCDEGAYFFPGDERLRSLDLEAYRLSLEWFHVLRECPSLSFAGPCRPEYFFMRPFYFCFLAIFRGLRLLERIRALEGPSELWTTHYQMPAHAWQGGMQFHADESPLPALLESNPEKWNFQTRFFALRTPSFPEPSLLARLSPSQHFYRPFLGLRSGEILFSGNPALLGPIARQLHPRKTLTVRTAFQAKDWLMNFKGNYVSIPVPPYPFRPFDFCSREVQDRLRSHKTFELEGVSFLSCIWPKISHLYRWEAWRITHFFHAAVRILKKLRPRLLILDEDATAYQKALTRAASEAGVPTLVMSHGLPAVRSGFVPLEADRIAGWGAFSRERFEEWGIPREKIMTTGCPKYDALTEGDPGGSLLLKRRYFRHFRWPDGRPLVLILPGGLRSNSLELHYDEASTSLHEIFKIVDHFLTLARAFPQACWLLKFRMNRQHLRIFDPLVRKHGGLPPNFKWTTDLPPVDLIRIADLVFNSVSSAAIETVLLRKPLVQMNFSVYPDPYPFDRNRAVPVVRHYDECFRLCSNFLRGDFPQKGFLERQEEIVTYFNESRYNRATERAAGLIQEMIAPELLAGRVCH